MNSDDTYARAAYAAYGQTTGNKTHDGREMPAWEDLGPGVQQAWIEAALAVLTARREEEG